MLDSIKMVKLDLLIIKGYTRQMILSYLMLTIVLITTLPYMLNIVYFVCASSFITYPFMVAEQSNMNQFYKIVSTTKKARIGSKYLEVMIYLGITVLALIPINLLIYTVAEEKPSLYLLVGMLFMGILFYCIVTSVQIHCCFRWGYAKSKIISMILPIGIGIGIPVIGYILTRFMTKEQFWELVGRIGNFIATHTVEMLIGSLLISGLSFLISYRLTFKYVSR